MANVQKGISVLRGATILNVADFEGGGGGMKSLTDKYLDRNIITLEFCVSSNVTSKFWEIKSDSLIILGHFLKKLEANNFASGYFRIAIQSTTSEMVIHFRAVSARKKIVNVHS